jgi:hypothetical protein
VDALCKKEQGSDAIRAVEAVFQAFLPWDIGNFLKGILVSGEVTPSEKDVIVTLLMKVYQQHKQDDPRSITLRQHASHYMALLATKSARQFLEQAWHQETDKWVQRGMMVGLALYCDREDILEQYIKMIRTDPETASLNIGYYLVYYGDQPQEAGYHDQGGETCEGTIQAIFRRLQDDRYRKGWALDLLTLATLIEQRGIKVLSSHQQHWDFLWQFCQQDYQDLGDLFQEEKNHVYTILQGANT